LYRKETVELAGTRYRMKEADLEEEVAYIFTTEDGTKYVAAKYMHHSGFGIRLYKAVEDKFREKLLGKRPHKPFRR